MKDNCRIQHFPISFFSVILGMAGFIIAYEKIEVIIQSPFHVSVYLWWVTLWIFSLFSTVYLLKILFFKNDVQKEFDHPVKIAFYPTFSISLLLLSIAFLGINIVLSKYFWIFWTIFHLIFTLKIVSIWMQHTKFKITHMNPSWFIPAVGNMLVPIAGMQHSFVEISWFFFSIGILFWIILWIIFFNRIIFHDPLPEKLLPTLFILIAPPAIACISSVKLTGELMSISKMLYYIGLFFTFLLFFQFKKIHWKNFYLSWWAYSFPLAAITIASILMFHETKKIFFLYFVYAFFTILHVMIAFLVRKTFLEVKRKKICLEEE